MRHGPFLVHLVFANEKAWRACACVYPFVHPSVHPSVFPLLCLPVSSYTAPLQTLGSFDAAVRYTTTSKRRGWRPRPTAQPSIHLTNRPLRYLLGWTNSAAAGPRLFHWGHVVQLQRPWMMLLFVRTPNYLLVGLCWLSKERLFRYTPLMRCYDNEHQLLTCSCTHLLSHSPTQTKMKIIFTTCLMSVVHSFILNIYIAPLQESYSEALPTPARLNKAVLRWERNAGERVLLKHNVINQWSLMHTWVADNHHRSITVWHHRNILTLLQMKPWFNNSDTIWKYSQSSEFQIKSTIMLIFDFKIPAQKWKYTIGDNLRNSCIRKPIIMH